jgi:chemotaxis protein MotA
VLIIIGILVVFASVIGGYLMENGQIAVLLQPGELLIIGGGAAGIVLVSNPSRNLRRLVNLLTTARHQPRYSRAFYLNTLKLLYTIFAFSRRGGISVLESDVEQPEKSALFKNFPDFLKDRVAVAFVCDSVRIALTAGLDPDEMERIMVSDIEVQRRGSQEPIGSLVTVADSLPGLGIVAAVLGVVVTMQALGGPAAEIGQKVAAALVGTFLGILLCYGVVGPISSHLECLARARNEYFHVIRTAMIASMRGSSPLVAAETARRCIPVDLRPTFDAMEHELRRNTRIPQQAAAPLPGQPQAEPAPAPQIA